MRTHNPKTTFIATLASAFMLLTPACPAQNLLINGGFENEPNWGGGVSYDGNETAMVGNEIPGWTIETNHAATIQTTDRPYYYLTISGTYSLNTDGEGYDSNNANLYQDFTNQLGTVYALTFDWQSWNIARPATNTQLEVSLVDNATSAVLFDRLYSYDLGGPYPVHAVATQFVGTGNSVRLRIQETPESGYNDDMFVVNNFSVSAVTNVGALLVEIDPTNVVNAGAQWQVDGGPFQASGSVVTNLAVGAHVVSFTAIAGWGTPASQTVTVALAATNTVTASYTLGSGALQVNLSPAGAVGGGAEWQVDGGAFQTNGAVVSSLFAGAHTVTFSTIPGWVTPAGQSVTVTTDTTNIVAGIYSADDPSQLTYIWAHNAVGQKYENCQYAAYYWPSNSSWTQCYETSSGCAPDSIVESAPANWDPADTNTPPLPVNVFPGGPGAVGVNVILGLASLTAGTYMTAQHVVLNNMTMQPGSSLGYSYSITLNQIDFQGDGTLDGGDLVMNNGGTMLKSGGTGTYYVDGDINATNDLFEVDSGTLAFPSGFGNADLTGTSTIAVSNNATLLLTVDSGAIPFLNGTLNGIGGGTVLFNNGSLDTSGGIGNLNFPGTMFQWTGGSVRGAFTNSGVINITNNGAQLYRGIIYNDNLINLADNSGLDFFSPGGAGPGVFNEAGSTFNIQGDSSLTTGAGAVYNYGLFLKSAGTGVSQITPTFENYGGTIEADTGTLALNVKGAGYYTNVTFVVSNGATIDFLTSNYNMTIEGNLTGSGGGAILMNNGTVGPNYGASLDFPGSMFQWQGGRLGNGYGFVLTNLGTLNVGGPVGIAGDLANSGTMIQSGSGGIGGGYGLYNNAGAIYDIQNDNGLSLNLIYNYGLFKKSAGTGTSEIAANFQNYGPNGSVEVDSGTLAVGNGYGNFFTNTSFVVNNGTTLILLNNNEFEGTLTASGGGTVLVTNGIISSSYQALLDFPGSMFQWAGGTLGNNPTPIITNIGTINVSGPVAINSYGYVANNGMMIQSGAGAIAHGVGINNNAGAVYDIQNDHGITLNTINNYGLIKKSGGAGTSVISASLYNYGSLGMVEVDSGVLALNGGYNQNYFTNTTFMVNSGATLDIIADTDGTETEGFLNGSGGGTVLMTNGYVYCNHGTTLNFPGTMFQWQGGSIGNSATGNFLLTNTGVLNVSGPVAVNGFLANSGTMTQSGTGAMGSGTLQNTGVYDIQNDNGISLNNLNNYALIKKSAGTGTSQINAINSFYNGGGTIEVDSGTLSLANGGYYFTNASAFVVSNGATLLLNVGNYSKELEGSLTGYGGGTVLMTNGTLSCNHAATLDFPGPMFQWQGGNIGNYPTSSPLMTNLGTLNISGPVSLNGYLANDGTVIQSGLGAMKSGGFGFKNDALYQIQNDNGVTNGYFNNFGVLEKTAGSATSVIYGPFYNYDSVQAASGTIQFNGGEFDQYADTLEITPAITFGSGQNLYEYGGAIAGVGSFGYTNGSVYVKGGVLAPGNPFGTLNIPSSDTYLYSGSLLSIVLGGPSQFGQLAVKNYIQLGGVLNVTLTNGYTPAIGTQFEIITNGSTGYGFARVSVPSGISVTYSNTGVYLTVTSAVPAQVESPLVSSNNFTFSFGTVNGQSYTVQQNTNLATPTWIFDTNIIGNGAPYQFITPATDAPQLFFRVSEP